MQKSRNSKNEWYLKSAEYGSGREQYNRVSFYCNRVGIENKTFELFQNHRIEQFQMDRFILIMRERTEFHKNILSFSKIISQKVLILSFLAEYILKE